MTIQYLVTNNGKGVWYMNSLDLTCLPSECLWLVPGTYVEDEFEMDGYPQGKLPE